MWPGRTVTKTRKGVRIGLVAGLVYGLLIAVPIARQPTDPQEVFPFYNWALFARVPGPEMTGYGIRLVEVDGTTFDPPLPIELAGDHAAYSQTVVTQVQDLGKAVDEDRPLEAERLRRLFEDTALRGRQATYMVVWQRWDIRDRLTCDCDIEWRELARWETSP